MLCIFLCWKEKENELQWQLPVVMQFSLDANATEEVAVPMVDVKADAILIPMVDAKADAVLILLVDAKVVAVLIPVVDAKADAVPTIPVHEVRIVLVELAT